MTRGPGTRAATHRPTVAWLTGSALLVPVLSGATPAASPGEGPVVPRGSAHLLVLGVWVAVVVFGRRPSPLRTLALCGVLAGPLVVIADAALATYTGVASHVAGRDAFAVIAELLRWAGAGLAAGVVALVILRLGRS
ncbi:hypothetical protein [Actinotalea fermentans]|uniref:Uncharacterized protein n=1 Tax=Actinotalea fermentans TaxID=43671 RepID=A0A511Z238_9CELL|nr:hypothetical protein [Actinotalea fermentans]GEN81456.1 hypothetical protein AFE02nite_31900 [Actinotalea fermentans]